jgi:hypothetical protein
MIENIKQNSELCIWSIYIAILRVSNAKIYKSRPGTLSFFHGKCNKGHGNWLFLSLKDDTVPGERGNA